jgi:hypothetical protein
VGQTDVDAGGTDAGADEEEVRNPRLNQIVLVGTFLGFSWLAMQAGHELGHLLGALAGGGSVKKVVLHPLALSHTMISPNPSPLLAVWGGPLAGAVLPLLGYLVAVVYRSPGLYLFRFFAGFCLIANGVYIGGGSLRGLADAGELLAHGADRWQLLLFGAMVTPLGLFLWHGLGPSFGLGKAHGFVSRTAAIVSFWLLAVIVAIEMAFGCR